MIDPIGSDDEDDDEEGRDSEDDQEPSVDDTSVEDMDEAADEPEQP